jgi:hypothetical protein
MEIRKILVLRGPNIWSRRPVLEAWVDLQDLKDSPSDSIPGFNDRLMAWLPTLIEHRCSIGERGGFFQRLRDGTYLAHILEHVTLELQTLSGTSVGFGKARETSEEGLFKVVVRYRDEQVAREGTFAVRDRALDDANHARVALERGECGVVVAPDAQLRLEPVCGRQVDVLFAEGWQHLFDVPEEDAARSDEQYARRRPKALDESRETIVPNIELGCARFRITTLSPNIGRIFRPGHPKSKFLWPGWIMSGSTPARRCAWPVKPILTTA